MGRTGQGKKYRGGGEKNPSNRAQVTALLGEIQSRKCSVSSTYLRDSDLGLRLWQVQSDWPGGFLAAVFSSEVALKQVSSSCSGLLRSVLPAVPSSTGWGGEPGTPALCSTRVKWRGRSAPATEPGFSWGCTHLCVVFPLLGPTHMFTQSLSWVGIICLDFHRGDDFFFYV